jgi:hypothetical protein
MQSCRRPQRQLNCIEYSVSETAIHGSVERLRPESKELDELSGWSLNVEILRPPLAEMSG